MRAIALLGRSWRVRLAVPAVVALCAAGMFTAQSWAAGCPAGAVTFVGASGGAWNVKANWSDDQVPGSSTDACWSTGTTVVDPSSDNSEEFAHSVTGGSLEIDGGDINLGAASSVDSLTMTAGGLNGNGKNTSPLTVNGPITWSGGAIASENGIFVNQTSSNITIDGSGTPKIGSDAVSTTGNVTITNTSFGGYGAGQLVADGTISFAPGTYAGSGQTVGTGLVTYKATGFTFSGATTLPQGTLSLTGGSFTVPADVTVAGFNTSSGTTTTVDSGGDLSADVGTISGTVTGQGTYTQLGGSNSTISGGGVMSIDNVDLAPGALEVGAGGMDTGGTYSVANTTLGGGHLLISSTGHATTGNLTMDATNTGIADGTLNVTGNILMTAGVFDQGGGLSQTGSGSFAISGTGVVNLSLATITTQSSVSVSNPALTGSGSTLTSTSTVTFAAGTYPATNGAQIGEVTFQAAGFDFSAGTTSIPWFELVQTGGTTTIPSGSTVTSYAPTLNSGTLAVDGTLSTNGGVLTLIGGTLTGTGTVTGDIDNEGGTISPGDAPGTLTDTGNYTQEAGGDLSMIVNGATSGEYSVFRVSGNLTLGGTLTIVPGGGFAGGPSGTDVPFLTYGGTIGQRTFATATVSPPVSGYTVSVDYSHSGSVGAKTVASSPPLPGSPGPAISGQAQPGATLSTTNGTWSNNPTTFVYQWEDCDSSGASCSDIALATNNTYLLTNSDAGHTIRVVVTATNATAPETSAATAPVTIPLAEIVVPTNVSAPSSAVPVPAAALPAAMAPENTGRPGISGTALPGNALTCSRGSWTGGPTGFAFQWSRNGSLVAGATTPIYKVQIADETRQVTCSVTASNAAGAGTGATSPAVLVATPGTLACLKPAGSLSGVRLGPFSIGMTRANAQKAITPHTIVNGHDSFCLYGGWNIETAYASTSLLKGIPASHRPQLKGRVILAMTSNTAYAVGVIRPGATLSSAKRQLRLGKAIHAGASDWYFLTGPAADRVLKVRGGVIQEVGTASRALLQTQAARVRFAKAFAAV